MLVRFLAARDTTLKVKKKNTGLYSAHDKQYTKQPLRISPCDVQIDHQACECEVRQGVRKRTSELSNSLTGQGVRELTDLSNSL